MSHEKQDNQPDSRYFKPLPCPVCNQQNARVVFKDLVHTCNVLKKAGIPLLNSEAPVDVMRCKNCGHKYLSFVITDSYLEYYYGVAESEYYDNIREITNDRRSRETKNFASFINNNCQGRKVLEIGSGLGFLLRELSNAGFDCTGVEPSALASAFSRDQLQLNVVTTILDTATFPEQKFDVIVLSDVVEHIYNINTLFDTVDHYLNPGGQVVILTGDSNSTYARICGRKWLYFFSWEHISFFNRSSISYLLTNHGMKLSYFKRTGHTGTVWQNMKIFLLTFKSKLAVALGFRKHPFYYMAFDHFLAIGTKK